MIESAGPAAADVERTVRRLVAEVLWLPEDELGGTTPLVELGIDSPLAIELTLRMEDTFGVHLPEDVVARLETIDQIVDYLSRRR